LAQCFNRYLPETFENIALNRINAIKREAAMSLDAKLEHVHALGARLDTVTTEMQKHDEVRQYLLKLIQRLETDDSTTNGSRPTPRYRHRHLQVAGLGTAH